MGRPKVKLQNPKTEKFAQLVASGVEHKDAYLRAGFTAGPKTTAIWWTLADRPDVRARITQLLERNVNKSLRNKVLDRKWVEHQLIKIYNRAMQIEVVTNPKGEQVGIFKSDLRNALKSLELFGREMGMFPAHVDVTHRSESMIEGTEEQILTKIAMLLAKLGAGAIEFVLSGIDDDVLLPALRKAGYEVARKERKKAARQNGGAAGDAGDAREADAQRLPAVCEAG